MNEFFFPFFIKQSNASHAIYDDLFACEWAFVANIIYIAVYVNELQKQLS